MKIRNGLVSNSSSASFVVKKYYLSEYMIDKIKDHKAETECDRWVIMDEKDKLYCSTIMDNFDLMGYMWKIGVPREAIEDVEGE